MVLAAIQSQLGVTNVTLRRYVGAVAHNAIYGTSVLYSRIWTKFWPREWLPSERGLEGASIYTFGYSADWATTKESTLTILDFAKKLNFDILMARLTDVPIIFVVHSMGGLVVKKVSS